MSLSPEDQQLQLQNFEAKGAAVVQRLVDAHAFPHAIEMFAITWLAKVDERSQQLEKASQAEMAAIAARSADASERSAQAAERQAKASEKANTRATLALIVSLLSAAATVIGIWLVHHDTLPR